MSKARHPAVPQIDFDGVPDIPIGGLKREFNAGYLRFCRKNKINPYSESWTEQRLHFGKK